MHAAWVPTHELLALATLAVAVSSALPRVAQAAPATLRLDGPRECPPPARLERAVVELAGHPVVLDGVSVTIRRGPTAWHARLLTPGGERELEGESCDAVVEAAALVLALGASPAPDATPPAAPRPAPTATAPSGTPSFEEKVMDASTATNDVLPVEQPQDARHEPQDGLALGFAAGVLAEVGLLPAPSLGLRISVDVIWRAWRLELAAAALLPRRAEVGAADAPFADIYWWGAQAAACRQLVAGFAGCIGAELGDLVGTGSGVDDPATAHGAWLAGTLAAVWRPPSSPSRGPWSWEVGAGAALAVVRPEFGFDGLGIWHSPSSVSGGCGWRSTGAELFLAPKSRIGRRRPWQGQCRRARAFVRCRADA